MHDRGQQQRPDTARHQFGGAAHRRRPGRDLAVHDRPVLGRRPRRERLVGFQDDDELVAAHPRERVAAAYGLPQTLADLDQDGIPGRVATGVVDALEAVQITEQDPDLGALPIRPGHGRLDAVEQQGTVRQAGQAVVQRRVPQFEFGGHRVVDVPDDLDDLGDPPAVVPAQRRRAAGEPAAAAVLAQHPVVDLEDLVVRCLPGRRGRLVDPAPVVGVHQEPGVGVLR